MDQNNREMEFTQGFFAKQAGPNTPDFIKLKMAIKADEFIPWLQAKADEPDFDGWVNLEVRESRGGKPYVCVDTWRPDPTMAKKTTFVGTIDEVEDLPF